MIETAIGNRVRKLDYGRSILLRVTNYSSSITIPDTSCTKGREQVFIGKGSSTALNSVNGDTMDNIQEDNIINIAKEKILIILH